MERDNARAWIATDSRRSRVLANLDQPMTAKQIARREGLSRDAVSGVLSAMRDRGLVTCLNEPASSSRLYWLTPFGERVQRKLLLEMGLKDQSQGLPDVDWNLYGWVCFRHRAAMIKALSHPMQPVELKRRACRRDSGLRMSGNNARDIMRLFLAKGIVQPVRYRGRKHLRYELTETGHALRRLLLNADRGGA